MDRWVITPNLFNFFVSCQLICTVIAGLISSLDWPSKTTPKWLLTSWNPLTSSQVTVISCHVSWFVQLFLIRFHHWIGLEKLPQIDSSQVEIHPLVPKLQWFLLHVSWFVQQLCWFDLTIHWAFKNYPQLTPHMLKFHHL